MINIEKELEEGTVTMAAAELALAAKGYDKIAVARIVYAHLCSILKERDRHDLIAATSMTLADFLIPDEWCRQAIVPLDEGHA